jgi:hypothetical protein
MQVKEGRCLFGPVCKMDSANYLARRFLYVHATLSGQLATVAFRRKSWILDRVCGLIVVPRISPASLRGTWEFAPLIELP